MSDDYTERLFRANQNTTWDNEFFNAAIEFFDANQWLELDDAKHLANELLLRAELAGRKEHGDLFFRYLDSCGCELVCDSNDKLSELMTDLARLGIRIEARGDRLRYSPRTAVTPDLAERMKAHKDELLATLRRDEGDCESCRCEPVECQSELADDLDANQADEFTEVIDPPDPCPKCGTLELWQSLADNWRCLRCDPPTKARRLRERAAQLRIASATLHSNDSIKGKSQ